MMGVRDTVMGVRDLRVRDLRAWSDQRKAEHGIPQKPYNKSLNQIGAKDAPPC